MSGFDGVEPGWNGGLDRQPGLLRPGGVLEPVAEGNDDGERLG